MVYSSGKKNDIALRFKIPPFLFTFGATVEKKSTDKKFTATNFEVLNYYHSFFFLVIELYCLPTVIGFQIKTQ